MTPDDIRNLSLPELRVEVAKALGWTDIWCGTSIRTGNSPEGIRKHLPDWPTSDADAVALLTEATKRGWHWHVNSGYSCSMYRPEIYVGVEAATFAEAVSRAFVMASEATKGGGK